MTRKRTTTALAASAAAVLLLAACGGWHHEQQQVENGYEPVLPNTAWKSASYDQVKQGGTLVQAVSQLPVNFNIVSGRRGLG